LCWQAQQGIFHSTCGNSIGWFEREGKPMMPAHIATPVAATPPRNLLWTVDQFHYLGDLGMFEGRRAMLIDGVIVEEGAMNPPHRIGLELSSEALRTAFGVGWRVCVQMPLILGQSTDPEPDIAVVAGTPRGNSSHPTTAALVVEVADSSLRFDTTVKLAAYAAGSITDYWVLDVNARQLLVFRDPRADLTAAHGHTYPTQRTLGPTDAIAPLAAPGGTVTVADLLP
jgi:Uma2 family endonuclease